MDLFGRRIVVIAATLGFFVVAGIAAAGSSSSCGGQQERNGFSDTGSPPATTTTPTPTFTSKPAPPPTARFDAAPPTVACNVSSSDAGDSPCDHPPPPQCLNETTIAYFKPGSCDGGTCDFVMSTMSCNQGCNPTKSDAGDYCVQIGGK